MTTTAVPRRTRVLFAFIDLVDAGLDWLNDFVSRNVNGKAADWEAVDDPLAEQTPVAESDRVDMPLPDLLLIEDRHLSHDGVPWGPYDRFPFINRGAAG